MATHALLFSLDISKTRTGVSVLRVPFINDDWTQERIEVIYVGDIIAGFALGAQRLWWPTAQSLYEQFREVVVEYRREYRDDIPVLAYEGAAYGQNTSEMMVYLQQRLFEHMDSQWVTNMDLLGFTPGFCRKATRIWVGDVDHCAQPKVLAKRIFSQLERRPDLLKTSIPYGKRISQDATDSVLIGLAAAISTVQFLRPRQWGEDWILAYAPGQAIYNQLSESIVGVRGATSHPHPSHPANFKEVLKDLRKRDEPHIDPTNPYVYPTRTYRIIHKANEQPHTNPRYLKVKQGLTRLGGKLEDTLIHTHA